MNPKPPRPLRSYVLPALFVGSLFVLLFLRKPGGNTPYLFTGEIMGTTWMVKTLTDKLPPPEIKSIKVSLEEELEDINNKMSTYMASTELSQFNQNESTEPITISKETFSVIKEGLLIYKQSQGAFDITIKPVVNAWGFGVGESEKMPTVEDIALLMADVGSEHIHLNEKHSTVQKDRPKLQIDLSAIAKGYAVDQLAKILESKDIVNYMVEVGGEVKANGKNKSGVPWRIGIEKPDASKGIIHERISLDGKALATSGDYRNFHMNNGERISHTVDARTGMTVKHNLASVSVIHDSAMSADAWATALTVLGSEAGMETAKRENLTVMMLIRQEDGTFKTEETPNFTAMKIKID